MGRTPDAPQAETVGTRRNGGALTRPPQLARQPAKRKRNTPTRLATCAIRQRHACALPATATSKPQVATASRGASSEDASPHSANRVIRKRHGSATASNTFALSSRAEPDRTPPPARIATDRRDASRRCYRTPHGSHTPSDRIEPESTAPRIRARIATHASATCSSAACCGAATSPQPSLHHMASEPIAPGSRREWRHRRRHTTTDRGTARPARRLSARCALQHRPATPCVAPTLELGKRRCREGIEHSVRSACGSRGECRPLP